MGELSKYYKKTLTVGHNLVKCCKIVKYSENDPTPVIFPGIARRLQKRSTIVIEEERRGGRGVEEEEEEEEEE